MKPWTKRVSYFLAFSSALLVLSCGSSDEEETTQPPGQVPTGPGPSAPLPGGGGTSIPGGSTGGTGSGSGGTGTGTGTGSGGGTSTPITGCNTHNPKPYYNYSPLVGYGLDTVNTPDSHIIADQVLRVSIEPLPAPASQTSGINVAYNKMAMRVHLLRNGVEVASKDVPYPSTKHYEGYGTYSEGIWVNYRSDPTMLDFSADLVTNGRYSIMISEVKTDVKCKNNCRPTSPNYAGHCYDTDDIIYTMYGVSNAFTQCNYRTSEGWTWTRDYYNGAYYCCDSNLVKVCQNSHCGVSNYKGMTTAGWSMRVRVETDSTTCIPR